MANTQIKKFNHNEWRKETVLCVDCNINYQNGDKSRHMKSKKHLNNINKEITYECNKHYKKVNERQKQKITCECGSIITKGSKSKHLKSKKHKKLLEHIDNIDNINFYFKSYFNGKLDFDYLDLECFNYHCDKLFNYYHNFDLLDELDKFKDIEWIVEDLLHYQENNYKGFNKEYYVQCKCMKQMKKKSLLKHLKTEEHKKLLEQQK